MRPKRLFLTCFYENLAELLRYAEKGEKPMVVQTFPGFFCESEIAYQARHQYQPNGCTVIILKGHL